MSAAPTMCENPCETCAKEGLPLLLTRYALMPSEIGAPRLSGQLDSPELQKVALGKGAHYGLRLLRSGYVYVFDEKRNHWDEYFVTTDGYLTKLPMRSVVRIRQQIATEFRCARNGAAPLAGVITIRNAKHAGQIWIAFSDVEWTDAVLKAHQSAGHRQQHMRCLTVKGGKIASQPDTAPLEQVEQAVPEFRFDKPRGTTHFAWGPHAYNARHGGAAALLQAVLQVRPGGGAAVVALHDPVGLAVEIAALAELRKVTFINHERTAKPRLAASTIVSLESTIKEQAKLAEITAGEELAQREENGSTWNPNVALAGGPGLDPAMAERWRTHTPAALQKAADTKWRAYTHDRTGKPRFDAAASQAWLSSYNAGLRQFDAEHIAPLAQAHVAWLKHRCMVSHLSCNYDSSDRDSGVAYTATIVNLMRYTLDKQPSYDLYLSWLNGGEFSEENLVMRAIGFNQKDLIEKIKGADEAPVDGRVFPTDAVAGAVAAFMEKMPAAANLQLTALLTGLSGPTLKYWHDFSAGKVGSRAAAAMAAISGRQYVRLPVVGNKGQFIQAHMQTLYRLDPTLATRPNDLSKAIAAQVRLLQIQGVQTKASSKLGWYVVLDKQVVAGATSKNLSGQALADELAKAIRTPEDLKKINLARSLKIRVGAAYGVTALGGVLMLVNFTKLLDDVEKGMSHEMAEATAKLMAGKVAIAGFVAEQLGNGLEKLGEARLRNMMGNVGAAAPRILMGVGRFAGFGVGVFMGLWDISKGGDASAQGDVGLARAYVSSGVAGIVIAATMFGVAMGWIVLGLLAWAFLAFAFVVWLGATFFIESNKDNKLQEWLARCHFGSGNDKYPDTVTHLKQYELALAG